MKTHLNHNIFLLFITGAILLIFNSNQLQAQGTKYHTPFGDYAKSFYGKATPDTITMDQVGHIKKDALMIRLELDRISIYAKDLLLMTLAKKDGDKIIKLMDFIYDKNTIKVRRYYNGNSYYKGRALQTVSFDSLINFHGYLKSYFEFKFYLHKHWMWIETRSMTSGTPLDVFYHSPFYFGMDYIEDDNNLSTFLSGSNNAIVIVYNGDPKAKDGTTFFGYDYDEIRKDIQTNYSNTLSPSPPTQSLNKTFIALSKSETPVKGETKEIPIEEKRSIGKSFVYPNPAESFTTLGIDAEKDTKIKVNVYDMTGKYLRTFDKKLKKGHSEINLETSLFHKNGNGMCFIQIIYSNSQIETHRLIIK